MRHLTYAIRSSSAYAGLVSLPGTAAGPVTRSHKQNDRDHVGLADGTASAEQHLPRYFGKHNNIDADPKKTKKDGAGKGNWGREGDELLDGGNDFNFNKTRRRSNSSTVDHHLRDFKTKFETIEPEPVFEEEVHGAPADEESMTSTSDESLDHDVGETDDTADASGSQARRQ